MKMSKKILPALAMLIVSAVMLSTASFAWFAMASSVTAENMNVSIKSDSAFLVIAKTAAEITGDNNYTATSVDFSKDPQGNPIADKELFPVAFNAPNDNNFEADTVWYEMDGTSAANGTGKGDQKPIAYNKVLSDYALLSTVFVATAKGSEDMNNLKASVQIQGDEAINVLVVVNGTAYQYFTNGDNNDANVDVPLVNKVTNTPIEIDIYVFYDGNHENITTNQFGLNQIDDTTVTVTFAAENE